MRALFSKRRLIFLGIIVVAVFIAGVVQPGIHNLREHELINVSPPGELGHIVLFTQALGAFRSIVIDVLWVRAMDLQNSGKFFELAQLYDLICQFEPHFSEIWIHNAWNMAYNISVQLPTAEERWSWVQKGVSLLRDRAIPLNPREADLYKELAWIYLHKIGDDLDNKHLYYKIQMVVTHDRLFYGKGDIKPIAEAPGTIEELFKDNAVRTLYQRLEEVSGVDPLKTDLMVWEPFGKEGDNLLYTEDNRETAEKLLNFLRKRYLKERLKLDPDKMLALNEKYGELDWRMPEVHGLYWAEESIPLLKYDAEKNPLFYNRYVYTAFFLMFRRGEPRFYGDMISFAPAPQWADTLNQVYLDLIDLLEDPTNRFSVENAYKNWLRRAAYILYMYNEEPKAREYHGKYYRVMTEAGRKVEPDFEIFVLRQVPEYTSDMLPDMATANIKGLIFQSLLDRDLGFEDTAEGKLKLAQIIHAGYMEENRDYIERFGIAPFEELYRQAVEEFNQRKREAIEAWERSIRQPEEE